MTRLNFATRALLCGFLALGAPLVFSSHADLGVALAKPGDPIALTLRVLDPNGDPVPTASLRNPEEEARHAVNAATGEYRTTSLFMPDGTEQTFYKGLTLLFEVSAPGYESQIVPIEFKKRGNVYKITLSPLNLDLDDEDIDGPSIGLQVDEPLDGR